MAVITVTGEHVNDEVADRQLEVGWHGDIVPHGTAIFRFAITQAIEPVLSGDLCALTGFVTEAQGLLDTVRDIDSRRMAAPQGLQDLLTQAVARRDARANEDIDAWADRLAREAAQHDD